MWERLQPAMAALGLDPVRVENPALPGTPDVNYIEGWLELKHADRWPPKGGPLNLDHPPTPQQIVWLYRRWERGGAAFLLLRVGQDWLLYRGVDVRDIWPRGQRTQAEMYEQAFRGFDCPQEVAAYLAKFKRMT